MNREIVRRVEGLFALADQLELRLAKTRGQVDQFMPSLLACAFAGQTVPPACRQAGKTPDTLPPSRPGVWFVYVIECEDGSFYIGFAEDLPRRWKQHVAGKASEWNRKHRPNQVFYWEECYSQTGAIGRKEYLKGGIGREWVKREVVDQTEAWEPAEKLLERIREHERKGK